MKKLIKKITTFYWKFIRTQFVKQYPVYSFSEPHIKKIKKGTRRYKYLVSTLFINGEPNEINVLMSRHDNFIVDNVKIVL